jgi:hypothetical protein
VGNEEVESRFIRGERIAGNAEFRVGAVRTQAPHLGEAEHLRDHFEAAVRLIGDVAEVVVELRHVRPGGARDRQLPERGQDEAFEVPAILLGCAGLHADRDVFPVEPLGQLLHRDRLAPRVPLGGGVRAVARGGDDGDGAVARLLAGQHRAGPEADPPGPASGAVLDHVALAPARQLRCLRVRFRPEGQQELPSIDRDRLTHPRAEKLEDRQDHAAYIGSCLQVLRDDKRAIFAAAAHAQRAANFLHGLFHSHFGAEERGTDLGNEFFLGIAGITEALLIETASSRAGSSAHRS